MVLPQILRSKKTLLGVFFILLCANLFLGFLVFKSPNVNFAVLQKLLPQFQAQEKELFTLLQSLQIQEANSQAFLLAKDVSFSSKTVDISSCNPNPKVIKVIANYSINFKNSDATAHTIHIHLPDGVKSFTIDGQSEKSIPVNFYRSVPIPLVHAYTCDNATTPSGAFFVSTPGHDVNDLKDILPE